LSEADDEGLPGLDVVDFEAGLRGERFDEDHDEADKGEGNGDGDEVVHDGAAGDEMGGEEADKAGGDGGDEEV